MATSMKQVWETLYRTARKSGNRDQLLSRGEFSKLDRLIAERAQLAAQIKAAAENGRFGVIVEGMDLNWRPFHQETVRQDRGVMDLWRFIARQNAQAGATVTVNLVKPSELEG
jgi:putative hemolysin